MGCVESTPQDASKSEVVVSGAHAKSASPAVVAKAETKRNGSAASSSPASIAASADVDYSAVRKAILAIMDDDQWDDGSYAPLLIRLAWHASGTYDAADGTGGSSGATMRFSPEKDDPESAGLGKARNLLEPIAKKFPGLSHGDLWVLAAYCAIECTGGPVIPFRAGRIDKTAKEAVANGRLPGAETGLTGGQDDKGRAKGWENLAAHIRGIFRRMGLSDNELVVLMCGGHVYGRCHTEHSGYAGAWVEEPTKFSNEYAADLVEDEWMMVKHDTKVEGVKVPKEVRPAKGKVQYMGKWSPSEEKSKLEALGVPDSTQYAVGRYVVTDDWINCRKGTEAKSDIIAQPKEGQEFDVLSIKVFGTSVRARLDVGGWCSVLSSSGEELMKRVGDAKLESGPFRLVKGGASHALVWPKLPSVPASGEMPEGAQKNTLVNGQVVELSELTWGGHSSLFGRLTDGKGWVLVVSPKHGALFERVVEGYNDEGEREAIHGKKTVKHQMMLVADMVLLWDPDFKKYLDVYAEDEEKLKKDFGVAYKKLTELGVPNLEMPNGDANRF